MRQFFLIFFASGVILGLMLHFVPHLFSGVVIKAKPVLPLTKTLAQKLQYSSLSHTKVYPHTKTVPVSINQRTFDISLKSVDKVSILQSARAFCLENAAMLNIPDQNIEAGCVNAVANHLFSEVYVKEMTTFPIFLSIPIQNHGNFDIQFDILQMAPRKVAESFCQEKQAQFGISNNQLEVGCTSNVEAFIVNELVERGVVDKGSADDELAAEEPEPLAQTVSEEIQAPVEAAAVTEPVGTAATAAVEDHTETPVVSVGDAQESEPTHVVNEQQEKEQRQEQRRQEQRRQEQLAEQVVDAVPVIVATEAAVDFAVFTPPVDVHEVQSEADR